MDYEWLYERLEPYYCEGIGRPGIDPVVLIKMETIPHFATVSYAFCKRFPPELSEEIFAHILNKALNNKAVDPSEDCRNCPCREACGTNKKGQRILTTHI